MFLRVCSCYVRGKACSTGHNEIIKKLITNDQLCPIFFIPIYGYGENIVLEKRLRYHIDTTIEK